MMLYPAGGYFGQYSTDTGVASPVLDFVGTYHPLIDILGIDQGSIDVLGEYHPLIAVSGEVE